MATSKTFKVAGITVHNGNAKVRFTDDMVRRVKQFNKGGASRADFIELPNEMSKLDALKYMLTHPDFQSKEDQATINDCISDREKEMSKGEVKVKAPKVAKTTKSEKTTKTAKKPSLQSIKDKAKAKKESTTESTNEVAE